MLYENVELHNVVEFASDPDLEGQRLCRIPEALRLKLNDAAKNSAQSSTCMEIRFNAPAASEENPVRITLRTADAPGEVQVYSGAFLNSSHRVGPEPTTIEVKPAGRSHLFPAVIERQPQPFDPALYRVVLPTYQKTYLIEIEGEGLTPPELRQLPARRHLAHGSSITHGASCARPTGMYAMRAAMHLEADLINLGFGGGAHFEPEMADYLAKRDDWDFATIEMGINMVGWADLDLFKERVFPFVETVARAHRDKWIFCFDILPFRMDFDAGEDKQVGFRQAVRDAVSAAKDKLGAEKLVYVEAQSLLQNFAGLTGDLTHPSPEGMEEIGLNLAQAVRSYMDK